MVLACTATYETEPHMCDTTRNSRPFYAMLAIMYVLTDSRQGRAEDVGGQEE